MSLLDGLDQVHCCLQAWETWRECVAKGGVRERVTWLCMGLEVEGSVGLQVAVFCQSTLLQQQPQGMLPAPVVIAYASPEHPYTPQSHSISSSQPPQSKEGHKIWV